MPRRLPKTKKIKHQKSNLKFLVAVLLIITTLVVSIAILKGFIGRKWDGKSRFTVISFEPTLQVKTFDPIVKQGIILNIPDDLMIESLSGRGAWRAEVILEAGDTHWAANSIADYLGIAYTALEKDLDWWDAWQWHRAENAITWREINLSETSYVEKLAQPDGLQVLGLANNWDLKVRDWFKDYSVASQALGVEIVNTTVTQGLGSQASRVVESMGFKVRSLTTSGPEIKKCIVKSQKEMRDNVATIKLRQIFDCSWEVGESGDLVLMLGREYLEWKQGN